MPEQRELQLSGEGNEAVAEMVRSYNQVSTSLSRSHWRRKLTAMQKALWDDLISWPTYCGLFHIDVEERAWYHGVDVADVTAALDRFQSEGKVKVRGTFIWVVEFVDHQSFNPNMRKAAASELRSLETRTSLASEALAKLNGTLQEGSPILDDTIRDETIQDSSSVPTAAQPRPRRGKPRAVKPEPEKYLTLAAELIWFIGRKIEAYNVAHGGLANDVNAAARELRLLIEADGFDEECILPALDWAWNDQWLDKTSGKPVRYGQFMLSIEQWRPAKFRKMYSKWQASTGGDIDGGASLRAKIQERMKCQPIAS